MSQTINYTYNPLYRLTAADYSNGDFYHYTYDAVGNRLTQQTQSGTTNYTYDIANRLAHVNGVDYLWDNNGNLLNDGVNEYSYDAANRLTAVSNQSSVSSYQYNGLGDRLQQTVNSETTNYTLDLNAGLTQVLEDGTDTYLYGMDRIAQVSGANTDYFLGDALGSVRQLADESSTITLSKSYDPYGNVIANVGNGATIYGYTGEIGDQTGLTYLRTWYYSPELARFLSWDTGKGDSYHPISYNLWAYANANPVLYTDPSGRNPLLAALLPALIGPAAGFIASAIAGGAFGYIMYPSALAGQCGCEIQQQAIAAGDRWQFCRVAKPECKGSRSSLKDRQGRDVS